MGKRRRESAKPRAPGAKVHSRLDQYAGIPQSERIAAITIDDPYATSAHAEATYVRGEWQAPARPRLEVMAAIRDDSVGKMYARRQIDDACFLAARHYQRSHEQAEALRRHAADPGRHQSIRRCRHGAKGRQGDQAT